MIRITHVLCPVDFSETSRHALDYAAAVAHWYQAKLTVLYVLANLPTMDLPPVVLDDETRQRLSADLDRFTAHLPAELTVDRRLREGSPVYKEIAAEAKESGADLLVIGSHGRSGFQRLMLGSVAERVIRLAPCPTMVVPPHAPDRAPAELVHVRKILCPIDFSDGSLAALTYALAMAEEADASLTLLHVVEIPPELRDHPLAAAIGVEEVRASAEEEYRRRLEQLVPEQARTFCTIDTKIREGAAYREILKTASEQQANLIVMGVQGRRAVDLMLFGSNTQHVMRDATCPVLTVRT